MYKYQPCKRLTKYPYFYNRGKSRSDCRKERYTYHARKADDSYRELKNKYRKNINLNEEEAYLINKILTPLIKNGQTINHLYINHPDILDFSKSSFYNYVNSGVFEFRHLNFPRIVKYKKRKISLNVELEKKEKFQLVENMKTLLILFLKILI